MITELLLGWALAQPAAIASPAVVVIPRREVPWVVVVAAADRLLPVEVQRLQARGGLVRREDTPDGARLVLEGPPELGSELLRVGALAAGPLGIVVAEGRFDPRPPPRLPARPPLLPRASSSLAPGEAWQVALLPGPGLLGLEGELLRLQVQQLLERAGFASARVRIEASGRRALLVVEGVAERAQLAAVLRAGFDKTPPPSTVERLLLQARASLELRRARVGTQAREQSARWLGFGVLDDSALPAPLGPSLRARIPVEALR